MPRLTGPLFSLTARNSLGKAVTYSSWRGIQYARQHTVPSNPQSTAQTEVRNVFKTLNALWLRSGPLARAPWAAAASGQPYTDRNRFMQVNQAALYDQTVMTAFLGSPGVGGAVPPVSVTPSDGGGQLLVLTAVQPTLPTGWTQVAFVGMAFLQGDPQAFIERTPVEGEDTVTAFTVVSLDVGSAGTYVWSAWNELLAPDGSTRYSVATSGTQVIA